MINTTLKLRISFKHFVYFYLKKKLKNIYGIVTFREILTVVEIKTNKIFFLYFFHSPPYWEKPIFHHQNLALKLFQFQTKFITDIGITF